MRFSAPGAYARLLLIAVAGMLPAVASAEDPPPLPVTLPDLVKNNRSAVVSIQAQKANSQTGAVVNERGTGFVLNTSGYVLTADHVVVGGPDVDVQILGSAGSREGTKEGLDVVFENSQIDVALLKFKNTAVVRSPVKIGNPWVMQDGDALYVLGFPGDEEWYSGAGTLSARSGPKGSWSTDLVLDVGTSGGPVFNRSGEVIAFVWGGAKRSVQGGAATETSRLSRIIPLNLAGELLIYAGVGKSIEIASAQQVTYSIDETLVSQMQLQPVTKSFQAIFKAKEGFVIADHRLVSKSATRVTNLQTVVAPDGKSMKVTYNLTSGPVYDQWRGWLDADIVTRQVPEAH